MNRLSQCTLCPRRCGVNRLEGGRGFCGAGAIPRVFRSGPHFGEEPPLSGTSGSGAIFFSHCTMRCLYCQNHPWSQGGRGDDLDVAELTEIFRRLAAKGCHNWNLVSPTPWLPLIREAVAPLLAEGIRLPFVYNSSGFESVETLEAYRDLVDIALVDLRYSRDETALAASAAPGYAAAARAALAWCWRELGPLQVEGDDEIASRGVICRLLVLPGRPEEAVENLRWLADAVGTGVHVSVMSQYTPVYRALRTPGWNRAIREDEYGKVTAEMERLGFDNGWVQGFDSSLPSDLLGQEMPAGEGSVGAAPWPSGGKGVEQSVLRSAE
ncbi:MAG: radical SAM protein [Kiritimatiellia bacterium]|jgi:putative pyruvate formate lyase activating enzyme